MWSDVRLAPNFMLSEFIGSDYAERHGIDNTPDETVINNLRQLAQVLQKVRDQLGKPVVVTSGYRCPALNQAIGGSKNSDHLKGLAADFKVPGYGTPKEVALAIIKKGIPFGQLINEGSWVHLSIKQNKQPILTAHFSNGGVTYSTGIV